MMREAAVHQRLAGAHADPPEVEGLLVDDRLEAIERLGADFGVAVAAEPVATTYRETIRKPTRAEGRFVRQTGGRGQYGHCILEVEPLEPGEGFKFEDKTVGGSIPREYIASVRRGVQGALASGVRAGYPVVDVEEAQLWAAYRPPPDPLWYRDPYYYDPWWPWGPWGI